MFSNIVAALDNDDIAGEELDALLAKIVSEYWE